jgi:membrane-associated protease RseP (regulator of RpoE activity)
MELMEGETVVGKPRLVVMTGRQARVEIGAVPAPAGTSAATQLGWQVDVTSMMDSPDVVKTSLDIKFTAAGDGGVTSTRSMSVDTRQMLGKTVVIYIPGSEGQQPLSLSLKTDLATQ